MGGALVVLLGDVDNLGIVEQLGVVRGGPRPVRTSERAEGREKDFTVLAKLSQLVLVEERVTLYLVGHGYDLQKKK